MSKGIKSRKRLYLCCVCVIESVLCLVQSNCNSKFAKWVNHRITIIEFNACERSQITFLRLEAYLNVAFAWLRIFYFGWFYPVGWLVGWCCQYTLRLQYTTMIGFHLHIFTRCSRSQSSHFVVTFSNFSRTVRDVFILVKAPLNHFWTLYVKTKTWAQDWRLCLYASNEWKMA